MFPEVGPEVGPDACCDGYWLLSPPDGPVVGGVDDDVPVPDGPVGVGPAACGPAGFAPVGGG